MQILHAYLKSILAGMLLAVAIVFPAAAQSESVEDLFDPNYRSQLVLDIEAAIAQAQAAEGVIPKSAAAAISAKASIEYVPLDDVAEEYSKVRHRMVALLNVWKRSLDPAASDYVHYGVTTVDVYDTVRLLQIKQSILFMIDDMQEIETLLIDLAVEHRDTPMIGRTLGQHALPITFGKKLSVWASANRRNIERLKEVLYRVERLGVLKGAVGTHLGLGPNGVEIEKRVSKQLGLREPDPADWHGMRDVFAEYALTLGLMSKSYAALGAEIFRLQMTDIGEVEERRAATAVGSSTMPHKRNPNRSEALIQYGRTVPRLAEVLLDDVENVFERDNTSRPNKVVEDISIESAQMLRDTIILLRRLEVHEDKMRENLNRTDGMVLAQRIVLFLTDYMGRDEAEERVRKAAATSIDTGLTFKSALLNDAVLQAPLSDSIDVLLNPETYLGLSAVQVDRTVAGIKKDRKADPAPTQN